MYRFFTISEVKFRYIVSNVNLILTSAFGHYKTVNEVFLPLRKPIMLKKTHVIGLISLDPEGTKQIIQTSNKKKPYKICGKY